MKIVFLVIYLVLHLQVAKADLQKVIYDPSMPSGLIENASVSITIKKVKRAAFADIGNSVELYLTAKIKPYNAVSIVNGTITKFSQYREQSLGDSPLLNVEKEYRNSYKKSFTSVVIAASTLNDLLNKYPNKDYANFRIYLYEDDFIGDEEIAMFGLDILDIKNAAKNNPFGFSMDYDAHDKKSGLHALLELRVIIIPKKNPKSIISGHRGRRIYKQPKLNSLKTKDPKSNAIKE